MLGLLAASFAQPHSAAACRAFHAVTDLSASFTSDSCKTNQQQDSSACLQPSYPVCNRCTANHLCHTVASSHILILDHHCVLQVHRTPVVALLSTGDEVVEPSTQHLQPGQIRDANRAMLVAACKVAGAQVVDLGIARDTEGHVQACLEKAINQQVDVLVTTGEAPQKCFKNHPVVDLSVLHHPIMQAVHTCCLLQQFTC